MNYFFKIFIYSTVLIWFINSQINGRTLFGSVNKAMHRSGIGRVFHK